MDLLTAHSLSEAYFYLMVTHCSVCGEGPIQGGGGRLVDTDLRQTDQSTVSIHCKCRLCEAPQDFIFAIPVNLASLDLEKPNQINITSESSKIIDVAQWITLYFMLCESANHEQNIEQNKSKARNLRIEARYCLEEALKFYVEDNDLPPGSAFFHEPSRERLASNPEQFSRSRLINLLASLPNPAS